MINKMTFAYTLVTDTNFQNQALVIEKVDNAIQCRWIAIHLIAQMVSLIFIPCELIYPKDTSLRRYLQKPGTVQLHSIIISAFKIFILTTVADGTCQLTCKSY